LTTFFQSSAGAGGFIWLASWLYLLIAEQIVLLRLFKAFQMDVRIL